MLPSLLLRLVRIVEETGERDMAIDEGRGIKGGLPDRTEFVPGKRSLGHFALVVVMALGEAG